MEEVIGRVWANCGCSVFKVLLKCWCSSLRAQWVSTANDYRCMWRVNWEAKYMQWKSGNHQGKRLKGKSIWGERSTSLLLLVCQNVFNGFIGDFSHLRNWHEKGLACNNFLSLTYKKSLFFFFENFTSDFSITPMPRGLRSTELIMMQAFKTDNYFLSS